MIYENLGRAWSIAGQSFVDVEDFGNVPHILNSVAIYNDVKYEPEYVQVAAVLNDIIHRCKFWTLTKLLDSGIDEESIELMRLINPKGCLTTYMTSTFDNKYAIMICMSNLRYHMDTSNMSYLNTDDLRVIQDYNNAYQLFKERLKYEH